MCQALCKLFYSSHSSTQGLYYPCLKRVSCLKLYMLQIVEEKDPNLGECDIDTMCFYPEQQEKSTGLLGFLWGHCRSHCQKRGKSMAQSLKTTHTYFLRCCPICCLFAHCYFILWATSQQKQKKSDVRVFLLFALDDFPGLPVQIASTDCPQHSLGQHTLAARPAEMTQKRGVSVNISCLSTEQWQADLQHQFSTMPPKCETVWIHVQLILNIFQEES